MKLPFLEFGDAANPPVVLVHGLFGQGKNLSASARALKDTHHVMSVDLRNHGNAPWHEVHDYRALAEDIFETFDSYDSIHVMGHSMGGKVAMMLALTRPNFVASLMIADMAPITYGHSYDDLIAAKRALDFSKIKTRRDADKQLAQDIPDAGTRAFLLHSLKTGDSPRWQNNLDDLEANMDKILGWPAIDAQYEGPTLFVGGANSDYVSEDTKPAIRTYFPKAKIMTIKNAGHWLHIEQPKIFNDIMTRFFAY